MCAKSFRSHCHTNSQFCQSNQLLLSYDSGYPNVHTRNNVPNKFCSSMNRTIIVITTLVHDKQKLNQFAYVRKQILFLNATQLDQMNNWNFFNLKQFLLMKIDEIQLNWKFLVEMNKRRKKTSRQWLFVTRPKAIA